jgi:hypothetical protein
VEGRRSVVAFKAGGVNVRFVLVIPSLFLHGKSDGITDWAFGGMFGHRGKSFVSQVGGGEQANGQAT